MSAVRRRLRVGLGVVTIMMHHHDVGYGHGVPVGSTGSMGPASIVALGFQVASVGGHAFHPGRACGVPVGWGRDPGVRVHVEPRHHTQATTAHGSSDGPPISRACQ